MLEGTVSLDGSETAPEGPAPEGKGSPEDAAPEADSAPRPGGRTPFARRLDDPQRVDGGGRWSVDSTRRRCSRCDTPFPDHENFHTVLEPAPAVPLDGEAPPEPTDGPSAGGGDEAPDVFVRRDYCARCFAESPPETVFAHWRCVLPPPPEGQRKVVNLASLLAHFHQLVETPAVHADLDAEGEDGDLPEVAESAPDPATLEPHIPDLPAERLSLVYLLALFLVRRRMLKWEGIVDDVLQLRCKESDRPVGLPVPPWSDAELARAIEEFEDLFR